MKDNNFSSVRGAKPKASALKIPADNAILKSVLVGFGIVLIAIIHLLLAPP
jgi:hypothetical protein